MKGKTIACVLLMLGILAGCGSGESSASPTPESSPPVDPVVSQTQPVTPDPAPEETGEETPEVPPEETPVELPPELGAAVEWDGSENEGDSVLYHTYEYGYWLYPTEADFLSAFGFEGADPFYEHSYEHTVSYGDNGEDGKLKQHLQTDVMRLYYDEELETGCVVYDSIYDGVSHKGGSVLGEVICQPEDDEKWTRWEMAPYTIPGLEEFKEKYESGEPDDPDAFRDYQEYSEYDDEGRLIRFEADGIFGSPWTNERGRSPVASVSLTYGEDGKLKEREIFRNDYVFSSTRMIQSGYYDELGRLCYETCYITHGQERFYYIYPDDGPAPAYCLYNDIGGSGLILVKY